MKRNKAMKEQKPISLGSFEEIVLLAIMRLAEKASGATVHETVSLVTDRRVSIGAIYLTIDRLERKGLIHSEKRSPINTRNKKPVRYVSVAEAGVLALKGSKNIRDTLRMST